jgi:alpha-mannosidase
VLRLYEPQGARGDVELGLPPGWELDAELDLLERVTGRPEHSFTPFQVRSWRLRPSSRRPLRG